MNLFYYYSCRTSEGTGRGDVTVIDGPREMSVYGDMMQFINCILIGGGGGCGARISSNGRSWVLLTVV